MAQVLLCGDVGGTNTRFQLVEVTGEGKRENIKVINNKKYRNEEHDSFLDVLRAFLADPDSQQKHPVVACLAVAGPVKNNQVNFTNRENWNLQGEEISAAVNIKKVRLVNDFLAVGYGILTLNDDTECVLLQGAPKDTSAPIACIGAGTGLGECFLTPTGSAGGYVCFPSEGGHAEFAPRNDLEIELLAYLKNKFAQHHRISVERIVSGTGLANIYEFLSHRFPEKVNVTVHHQIETAGDLKGAIIASSTETCSLCQQTMEIFAGAYGAEAGVAGLKWLPCGGLYLTGGLTPKNMNWIQGDDSLFMKAFRDKGRVSGILKSIPVYAVMVEDLGERGAEYIALQLLNEVEQVITVTI